MTERNGRRVHLVVANIHEGDCGLQDGSDTVGFLPSIRVPRVDRDMPAVLDGAPVTLVGVRRSPLRNGFYLAEKAGA